MVIDLSSNYIYVAAGDLHACAITADNVLKCWGAADYGKLNDRQLTSSPMYIPGIR